MSKVRAIPLIVLAAFVFSASADDYNPYIEKFTNGEINWQEGFVTAKGKGLVPASGDVASAMRAADVDARGNLIKIMNEVRFDGENFIGDLPDAVIKLKGFIRGAEKISGGVSGKFYEVELKAPIKGVTGLSAELSKASYGGMPDGITGMKASLDSFGTDKTVVVIDVRGTGLNPAIFPVIKSADGTVIYSRDTADPESLARNGMMSYVVSGDFSPAMMRDAGYEDFVLAQAAPEKQEKRERKRGYDTIEVQGSGSDGKLKANVVVSAEDAEKLVKADKDSSALKDCRVVVVMDSEVGGIEGKFFRIYPKQFTITARR